VLSFFGLIVVELTSKIESRRMTSMTGTRKLSRGGWLGVAVVAAIGTVAGFASSRVASPTPVHKKDWNNVLEAAYAGNAECARCHEEQANHYKKTGHAHTLQASNLCDRLAAFTGREIPDPERDGSFRFECRNGELFVRFQKEMNDEIVLPVQFALGSGKHALTFLTLLEDANGEPAAIEHRLSLMKQETEAALTPSHVEMPVNEPLDCLGRMKRGHDVTTCIGCHSTTGQVRGTRVDDLRANVGCESCHGPGRQHIANVEAGGDKLRIEFGRGRATAEQELHLCGRCHRSTEALSVVPDPDNPKLARFQPVGLSQSACFRRSDGALKCSTCHDPHQAVDLKAGTFNARCQSCHSESRGNQTVCLVQPAGDCTSCHMPAIEIHPGISFHDHWIRRHKDRK
jgi:hypothetical protein